MLKRLVTINLMVLLFWACSQEPSLKRARAFLDSYYVMANQAEALKMSSGLAASKIKKEIELLKTLSHRHESYRARDVLFKLVRQRKKSGRVTFMYELTIKIPHLPDRKQLVSIIVDPTTDTVKYFGEAK